MLKFLGSNFIVMESKVGKLLTKQLRVDIPDIA